MGASKHKHDTLEKDRQIVKRHNIKKTNNKLQKNYTDRATRTPLKPFGVCLIFGHKKRGLNKMLNQHLGLIIYFENEKYLRHIVLS